MTLAVELKNITRVCGTVLANDGVSLSVRLGSIHAIIGENGAGKSTAMKILYGEMRPDSGEIWVGGERRSWRSPADAIAAGLGMVHQHFALAEPFSALENIILGAEGGRGLWRGLWPLRKSQARSRIKSLAERFGMDLDWDVPVQTLSVGERQRIEILKLLYRNASILILDEPTAVLTPAEVEELFGHLRRLAAEGKAILLITHKLKEVMALADEVTVLRAGKVVSHARVPECSAERLAEMMVGRAVELHTYRPAARPPGPVVAEVRGLTWTQPGRNIGRAAGVNLRLRAGEIVGVAGVDGNGQAELLEFLHDPRYASRHGARGELWMARALENALGNALENATNFDVRQLKRLGCSFVPADRHQQALLLDRPLTENFLIGREFLSAFQKRGGLKRHALEAACHTAVREFQVRTDSIQTPIRSLSGGNQQKWILAREFWTGAGFESLRVLVVAQPTRGVDIGAIEAIHHRIRQARDAGVAVLVVSSELDEVLALSDRVIVLYRGEIQAEFHRPSNHIDDIDRIEGGESRAGANTWAISEQNVGRAMAGLAVRTTQ